MHHRFCCNCIATSVLTSRPERFEYPLQTHRATMLDFIDETSAEMISCKEDNPLRLAACGLDKKKS